MDEIIEAVRTLAIELSASARGTRPGFLAGGTKERAAKLTHELVEWFNKEQDIVLHYHMVLEDKPNPYDATDTKLYPQYVATDEISRRERQATAKGNVIRPMIGHLVVMAGSANCSKQEYKEKIVAAGFELSKLCDDLQALTAIDNGRKPDAGQPIPDAEKLPFSLQRCDVPQTLKREGCKPVIIQNEDHWKLMEALMAAYPNAVPESKLKHLCKRRREIVALGGRKVQRPA